MPILLLAGLLLLLAPPLVAQRAELHVNPGARVRISAPELAAERLRGQVESLSADTLVLFAGTRGVRLHIPRTAVHTVEMSTGRNVARRAAIGGALGTLGGFGAGVALSAYHDLDLASIPVTLFMMLTGAVSGAIVGGFTAPERWWLIYSSPAPTSASGRP
jgi:hypothetical protein